MCRFVSPSISPRSGSRNPARGRRHARRKKMLALSWALINRWRLAEEWAAFSKREKWVILRHLAKKMWKVMNFLRSPPPPPPNTRYILQLGSSFSTAGIRATLRERVAPNAGNGWSQKKEKFWLEIHWNDFFPIENVAAVPAARWLQSESAGAAVCLPSANSDALVLLPGNDSRCKIGWNKNRRSRRNPPSAHLWHQLKNFNFAECRKKKK